MQLMNDILILYPGERVAVEGAPRLSVYPLALWHVGRFAAVADVFEAIAKQPAASTAAAADMPLGGTADTPQELIARRMASEASAAAADPLAALAAVLAPVMFSAQGVQLLASCCSIEAEAGTVAAAVSPAALIALPDHARGAVLAAWTRQSFAHLLKPSEAATPSETVDTDGERFTMPSSAVLSRLVAGGHPVQDVFQRHGPAFDGRSLPFPGWTLGQLSFWIGAVDDALKLERAATIEAMAIAVGGVFGGEKGSQFLIEHVRSLRSGGK